jgi:hypothetical protein
MVLEVNCPDDSPYVVVGKQAAGGHYIGEHQGLRMTFMSRQTGRGWMSYGSAHGARPTSSTGSHSGYRIRCNREALSPYRPKSALVSRWAPVASSRNHARFKN